MLDDVNAWRISLVKNSQIMLKNPDAAEMIESVSLPDLHKDPFDRLLIAQALNNNCSLVTKDEIIKRYNVKTFWI
nr:type II toxin-antitoxin system VapC family toxin [uncultured Desulfobacter sp.]